MSTIEATIPVEILELSPYAPTRSTIAATPLSAEELRKTEAYWRACNYLSLGMIYLQQNPLLEEPLRPEHIKNRLLGHWGSSPLQYLNMDKAIIHCTKGIGIWDWASNDEGGEPDVVMASAGDIPTQEALAATALLRKEFPDLKIRFINVVDLFKLQPSTEHPHGLSD